LGKDHTSYTVYSTWLFWNPKHGLCLDRWRQT